MSTVVRTPAASSGAPSTASEPAAAAFAAGWLIAQLHGPILDRRVKSRSPLPTVNELGRVDRVDLTLKELHHLIAGPLAASLAPDGDGDAVSVESLSEAWDPQRPADGEALKRAAEKLHVQLLEGLTVTDRIFGSAYSTGRSLSDTCWLSRSQADFTYMFNRYRLANLQGWLSDIAPSLPKLSAAAVSQSLDHWVAWLAVHGDLNWNTHGGVVEDAARTQGEHWRALLAGDKDPTSLLTPEGYVQAGEAALRRAGTIIRRAAIDFWVPLLFVAMATALAIAVAIRYSEGTAKFWATAISLASGLGVTGKSLQATAKRLASDASKPLLDLADADAISWALTWLPPIDNDRRQERRLRKLGVAPPLVLSAEPGDAKRRPSSPEVKGQDEGSPEPRITPPAP